MHFKALFFALLFPVLLKADLPPVPLKIKDLRTEYLVNPLGLDVSAPRFGWKIAATNDKVFNQKQSAYQVLVASSPGKLTEAKADLWNSGKQVSNENAQVVYKGKPLASGKKYFWTVRIWNDKDEVTPWSDKAFWSMGLLEKQDWKAKWIGDRPDEAQKAYKNYLAKADASSKDFKNERPAVPSSPMLRKKFNAKPSISEAILYVSALGYYEIAINGQKVGDHVLTPEWTDYDKRVQYQAYDVSKMLKPGANAISALLGDGWYLSMIGPTKWHHDYPRRGVYGDDRRLIAQMEIRYTDGTKQIVATDETWKINTKGFIIAADNFLGQKIDARNIPANWRSAEFNDAGWANVYVDARVNKNLEAQKNEPIRIYKYLEAKGIKPLGDKLIVDFGQNLTGWTKMKINGNKGDKILVRHGEMLDDDGSLYTKNLAAAIQEDEYVLSGNVDEFQPIFTYHGFRYIEISGLKDIHHLQRVQACALSSDPVETGSFSCSNAKLNQLWSNILWTQRNNMTSVPTDCPQRDERMGWMGDAQVFCQNSMFNMDMAAFYTKWMQDVRDAQSQRGTFPDIAPHANKPDIRFSNAPAWADAGVIIPWRMYENYGDKELLRRHYDAMKRYIENIRKQNPDHLWLKDVGNQYGDWLNANTVIAEGYSRERGEVPKEVFATAFYANSVRLFRKMAEALGNTKDAEEYGKLFDQIRAKFNKEYVNDSARIKGNTQSAYALALNFELLPKEKEALAFDHMIECIKEYDYRISTGFITTLMMMKELTKRGRNDIAYTLLESERMPSWLYSINQGATTIWERWDGYVKGRGFQDAGMNSFCHYSLGSVGEWMYRVTLGINPDIDHPGYKHFFIHPQPGGSITWAKGSYESINGLISVDWKDSKQEFVLNVEIPVNTMATVVLPKGAVKMNGEVGGNETRMELGSGKYSFVVTKP